MRQAAVDEQASTRFYRGKHSWISTAGPDCFRQRPGTKHNAISGGDFRGCHRQRDLKFLETPDFQDLVEEFDHPAIGEEAVAGNGQLGKVTATYTASDLFHLPGGRASAIERADEGADTA